MKFVTKTDGTQFVECGFRKQKEQLFAENLALVSLAMYFRHLDMVNMVSIQESLPRESICLRLQKRRLPRFGHSDEVLCLLIFSNEHQNVPRVKLDFHSRITLAAVEIFFSEDTPFRK